MHWLEGGSLLGAVRERGALLAWEDDVDISVLLDGDVTWEWLTAGLAERGARDGYFVDRFEREGFVTISFDPPKRWPFRWQRNRLRGEIRVDIVIYRRAISHGEPVLERRIYKGAMRRPRAAAMACRRGLFYRPRRSIFSAATMPARTKPRRICAFCTATSRRSSIRMSIRGQRKLGPESTLPGIRRFRRGPSSQAMNPHGASASKRICADLLRSQICSLLHILGDLVLQNFRARPLTRARQRSDSARRCFETCRAHFVVLPTTVPHVRSGIRWALDLSGLAKRC